MVLRDKVIIITGAASGIGAAAARIFAEGGAKLMLADRSGEALEMVRSALEVAGHTVQSVTLDVASEPAVENMVAETIRHYGRLDGAFNNAGITFHSKAIDALSVEEWKRVNDVNSLGAFLCMKYEIAAMRGTGGAIVNTSSANGVVANPYSAEYVASKHAVLGLTRAGSTEAVETRVRVNAVLPGMIDTPMNEPLMKSDAFKAHYDAAMARHTIGRFGKPEDVAYAARWLLSDEAAFVNGAALAVDGGYTAR